MRRSGGRALLVCAAANGRARWWEPLIQALVSLLTAAVVGAGLITAISIPTSYLSTKERLNGPDLWVGTTAKAATTLYPATQSLPDTTAVTPLYLVQNGVVRTGGKELPAAISPLPASPPAVGHLTVAAGAWPSPDASQALLERGAAGSLGAGLDSSLTVVGAGGTSQLKVVGLVRDSSRASYPLTSPAMVYVSEAAWRALGGDAAARSALFGVAIRDRSRLRPAAFAIRDLVPAGTPLNISGGSAVVDGLAPLTLAIEGFLILFGLFGLAAAVAFIVGTMRADLVRQARSIGILRATGWSAGRVRALQVLQRAGPVLLGALVGDVVAIVLAGWMTGQVVQLMGLDSTLSFALPTLLGVTALTVLAAVAAVLLATLGLGRSSPASTIAAGYRHPPSRLAAVIGAGRGGLAPRLGAAFLLGRPGRSGTAAAVLVLGLVTVIFSVVTDATLANFGSSPASWGYAYDWRVDYVKSTTPAQVETALNGTDGIAAALPVYDRAATIAGTPTDARFTRPDQDLIRYHLLAGRAISSEREVLVGAGLATATGLRPGQTTVLKVGQVQTSVTVAGIYRELDNLGQIVSGRESLLLSLDSTAVPDYFVARLTSGADAKATRSRLEQAVAGRVVVTSVGDLIAVPLGDVFRAVLLLLGVGLTIVAGMVMLAMAMILADEHAFVVGILKAIGARHGQLAASLAWAAGLLIVPALVLALPAGLALTTVLIGGLSAVVGGVDPVVPSGALALSLALALLAPIVGFALPAAAALRASPVQAIAMER